MVADGQRYFDSLVDELNTQLQLPVQIMTGEDRYWVNITTMDGTVLQIGFSSQLPQSGLLYVWLPLFLTSALLVAIAAFLVVRRISQPLIEVSERASSFRGEEDFEPLPEAGPQELASLASSFNRMAAEIATLITNRTTLLAGISHDIRTPLTRMLLALEMLPESVDKNLIERFKKNLHAIDDLISDASSFVKGVYEESKEVEIGELLNKVIDDVDAEIEISWTGDKSRRFDIAPAAFQRVLNNLIDNALFHANGARINAEIESEKVAIHVLDDGPGIPEEDRLRVLQPFVRLDTSRSSATGGSGLGLAVVAQLCQTHDWKIEIGASETGGTDAILTLSREAQNTNRLVSDHSNQAPSGRPG